MRIHVAKRQLEHWDASRHAWALGSGRRTVWAGDSSADLALRAPVRIP